MKMAVKRMFDVAIAAILLVALAPVLLVVALVVLACHGRPVLYAQLRPGLGGKAFVLLKFRTMSQHEDAQGRPLPDEQRMTRIGRWLRAASIDELPELWNVLRGDMSLVGPRPLLMEYLPLYSPAQWRRHEMRPGMTGWAQVNGRNDTTWQQRLEQDVWYVDHWSLGLDARILAMTVVQVICARGINQPGQVTMERFRGNAP